MKNLKNKSLGKKIAIGILVLLVISGLFSLYSTPLNEVEKVSLSQLAQEINEKKVDKIEVEGNKLAIELQDGTKQESLKEPQAALAESLKNIGVENQALNEVKIDIQDTTTANVFVNIILPFLLPFLLIAFFIWFLMRQAQRGGNQAMSFGASKARMFIPNKDKKKRITFNSVAGSKEAKEELYEVVDFLKNPRKFVNMGAKIPRGFLLLGSPGTGKTLLAKAVAGEANVPFFSISGSEFVEMFVGVGASRVRDLFKQAKKSAPAIVFIDEIDAVGRQRGTGLGGGHDEREQTLNQILVEMDGFNTDAGVIVIAATNRPDVLDPALLRPGRFDRRIVVDNPDIKEREAILKIHQIGKRFEKGINMRQIAERTAGFSGADLANLLNEAAILTVRRKKKAIGMDELRESIEKVILGPERRSNVVSEKEKEITAYHEAGHALVANKLDKADDVQKISIIARGRAAGYTLNTPKNDERLHFKSYFIDQLAVLLAGYATETKIYGEVTSGASNDLKRATDIARKIVTKFGMSDLGPITYGSDQEKVFLGKEFHDQSQYSDKMAEKIDNEVQKVIDKAWQISTETLSKNEKVLKKIAEELLEKETIEKERFDEIVGEVKKEKAKSSPR
jgi:cell division protease FtsH